MARCKSSKQQWALDQREFDAICKKVDNMISGATGNVAKQHWDTEDRAKTITDLAHSAGLKVMTELTFADESNTQLLRINGQLVESPTGVLIIHVRVVRRECWDALEKLKPVD